MRRELAERTYDERITMADTQRRCGKELEAGGVLKAVVQVRTPNRPDGRGYRVVKTGLIIDGKIVMHYQYRNGGCVVGVNWGAHQMTITDEWPATLPEPEVKPTPGTRWPTEWKVPGPPQLPIVLRTNIERLYVSYEVRVSHEESGNEVLVWHRVVNFGMDDAHCGGGTAFVEAAREQERVAAEWRAALCRGQDPR